MIELERTFLAKQLPDLNGLKSKEVFDIYMPKEYPSGHAPLRLRKNGDKYELTKKEPAVEGDSSKLIEQTINLTEKEFTFLEKEIEGRRIHKIRYYLLVGERTAEIDVFQDDLKGLVLIDFEFENEAQKDSFVAPDFCLKDVTQEEFIAGGVLCGKKYSDLEEELKAFGYNKL